MLIKYLSDTHNFLPKVGPCDLLVLAGDYCAHPKNDYIAQSTFLNGPFLEWLKSIASTGTKIVGVWGNHDVVADKAPFLLSEEVRGLSLDSPWIVLNNSSVEILGRKIWGTPYSREFGTEWGFNAKESQLNIIYQSIPLDTDFIISHGPAYGYGDRVDNGRLVGNITLTKFIQDNQPLRVYTGHIHNGRGAFQCDQSVIINCAYVDDDYIPHHIKEPFEEWVKSLADWVKKEYFTNNESFKHMLKQAFVKGVESNVAI